VCYNDRGWLVTSRRWSESPEELPDSSPSEIETVELKIEKATAQFSIFNFQFCLEGYPAKQ
jgi:hypothetical protein